jgi:hypothetical protein
MQLCELKPKYHSSISQPLYVIVALLAFCLLVQRTNHLAAGPHVYLPCMYQLESYEQQNGTFIACCLCCSAVFQLALTSYCIRTWARLT